METSASSRRNITTDNYRLISVLVCGLWFSIAACEWFIGVTSSPRVHRGVISCTRGRQRESVHALHAADAIRGPVSIHFRFRFTRHESVATTRGQELRLHDVTICF